MQTDLALRFRALWKSCVEKHGEVFPVWDELSRRYQEKHRFYHTLEHVAHCLRELDEAGDRVPQRAAVELAIWFHDVIYDLGRSDNEAMSADYFSRAAGPCMPRSLVDLVAELILATVHLDQPQTGAAAYMVDIDLSSFGLPWEEYLRDSQALRREDSAKNDGEFYPAKLRFLQSLLARPSIFQTGFFRQRHERNARENIARYSAMIRERFIDAGT